MDVFFNAIGLIVCAIACIWVAIIFVSFIIREMYIGIRKKWDKKLYARIKREIESPYIADKIMMEAYLKSQDDYIKGVEYAFKRRMDEMSMDAYGKTCDDMDNERFDKLKQLGLLRLGIPERLRCDG